MVLVNAGDFASLYITSSFLSELRIVWIVLKS